jgi:hypothetical protein
LFSPSQPDAARREPGTGRLPALTVQMTDLIKERQATTMPQKGRLMQFNGLRIRVLLDLACL